MNRKSYTCAIFLFFSILLTQGYQSQAQNAEIEKKIKKADAFLNIKDYAQALPLYLELDKTAPKDPQTSYAIGTCYFNLPGEIIKSIPYFEFAVQSKDQNIPPRVHYNLGKAYHLSGKFDEAIAQFNTYKTVAKEAEKLAEATRQIQFCNNAKALNKSTAEVFVQNMGAPINTKYTEYGPVISADERILIYTSLKPLSTDKTNQSAGKSGDYEDVYTTAKMDNSWSEPKSIGITPPVVNNIRSNIGSVGLSPDGQKLLLYMGTTANTGDIYSSLLQGDKWAAPVKMGKEVNSNSQESSASLTPDEKIMYFASNRPGGIGGMDIYKVEKQANGEWGSPINLGPTINTPYDEEAPFIHPDKKTLYFASDGHNSMGGDDIFKATLDKGRWSVPVNLGSPINTPYDDNYFALSADGKKGYFSSDRPGGLGGQDIYFLGIPEEQGVVPLTMMKGKILAGNPAKPLRTKIKVIDKETHETIKDVYNPNAKTGDYLIIFPPGKNYDMVIEAEGYKPYLVNIYVPNQNYFYELYQEILLNPVVGKDGKVVGQEISVKNAFYDVEKDGEAKAKQNNAEIFALMGNIMSAADSAALSSLLAVAYEDPVDMKSLAKNEPAAGDRYMYADASGKLKPFVVGSDTLYTMAAVDTKDVANKPATERKEQITKETIIKPNQIYIVYFDTDKSNLKSDAVPELEKVYDFLKKNPSYGIKIAGHTDNVGTKERNQTISETRAKEVAKYMVTKGITAERTLARGYGQTDPLNGNATEEEKKKNRRVEITLVELKKAS